MGNRAERGIPCIMRYLIDGHNLIGQLPDISLADPEKAVEGRDAFLEKRDPDWTPFPRYF